MKRHLSPLVLAASVSCQAAGAAVSFTIDASRQEGGNRVFHHVPRIAAIGYNGLPEGWMIERFEDTIWENADWFGLSNTSVSADQKYPLWKRRDDGAIVFEPSPGIAIRLNEHVFKAGVKPLVVMGTPTIPAPLVEGGKQRAGTYGFNIRQPHDYVKWGIYLDSLFQWLVEQYGKDEVRGWGFLFGIEADWQAKAVYPGTDDLMNRADNCREFLKMVDHFQAALERTLGPGVYLGVYGAFEHQSKSFIEHWAAGTNTATGSQGTRVAFTGFSDWTLVDRVTDLNPLSRDGEARRAAQKDSFTEGAAVAAGLAWKHDHVAAWANAYPGLRGLEVNLPEAGYFDTTGGTTPDGRTVPADFLPADHQGAALYGLRLIAYSRSPRLTWAWNRYALGTGDIIYNTQDTAKAPVFQAQRISRQLHGHRILPVARTGLPPNGIALEAMALASSDTDYQWTVLVASFSRDHDAASTITTHLVLNGMDGLDRVRIGMARIDATHNNWWPEWTRFRDKNDMPFVAGPNHGHLGANVLYRPDVIRNTNDVLGTMRPQDHARWLAQCGDYAHRELEETKASDNVPVVNGAVTMELSTPANSLTLITVKPIHAPEPGLPVGLLEPVSLPLGNAPAHRVLSVTGLLANTNYTLTIRTRSAMRVAEYGVALQTPDGVDRVEGFGDYSGRWNPIVLTTRTDATGTLDVIPFTPAQRAEADDIATFEFISLTPTVPRALPLPPPQP